MSDTKASNADRDRGSDARSTAAKRTARYGDTNRRLPGKLIVVGIIGMLVVAAAYIFVQMNRVSTPDVTATQAGWAREEGREDDVFIFTLDVTREDPSLDAYCIIYALNYDVAEVGRRDVFIPAGGPSTVRLDVPIQTREKAVAGDVYGCSTEMPEFLSDEAS
ncbi:DUF4307 domain-containing protein [Corynebacterium freneyi]|uniref:DUF4307 domain-containing protein n=1 Tax=Corynebacterium freneyi DNF00450 TaxID=1287475 RepID=A0A096A473_9CORY|nr:DUF4307 domain-containing protein [Corynebacterium freneyi]KGF15679.1 hypothetical protein HMPREF1650_10500 [Corynebacterium freneyi DNF00450]